jgi:glycosyltransferase involved in cell wall biosynthesis/outer membrane murein-binding lipoprotein Lpp
MIDSTETPLPPHVLVIIPQDLPSATIYIVRPLLTLVNRGLIELERILEQDVTADQIESSDLVVFCRNQEPAYTWILEACQAKGIPTIYELDDNLWEVPVELYYAAYHTHPVRLEYLEHMLRSVDLVRVYSPLLHRRVLQFNRNAVLVNPCIDVRILPSIRPQRFNNRFRITYATGRGNTDPILDIITEPLIELYKIYPDQIETYWWGESPDAFNSLDNVHVVPIIRDYEKYIHHLYEQQFDIGLAPMHLSAFYLSKTNTKFRDYGIASIAGVYSDIPVYNQTVVNGHTGMLVENEPQAWFEAIKRLIEQPRLRRHIQIAAYQYVARNYNQELAEAEWEEIIATLIRNPHKRLATPARTAPLQPLKIRLGVGGEAPPGFRNVDLSAGHRLALPAPDDKLILLEDDSADLVLADSALEFMPDLSQTIKEIFRICSHGAQVVILSAYVPPNSSAEPGLFRDGINEFTPQRLSQAPLPSRIAKETAPTDFDLVSFPEFPGVDLRCLQMEMFYTPEYEGLSEDELRSLRRKRPLTCDQILLHLVAVKRPISAAEFDTLTAGVQYYEPPGLNKRRSNHNYQDLINRYRLLADNERFLASQFQQFDGEIKLLEAQVGQLSQEKKVLQAQTEQLEHERSEYAKANTAAGYNLMRARSAIQELDTIRNRRVIRMLERILGRQNAIDLLSEEFTPMLDEARLNIPHLNGYVLQPGTNLMRTPYLTYTIEPGEGRWTDIWIALLTEVHPETGIIGMDIFTQSQSHVTHTAIPANNLKHEHPLRFHFDPIETRPGQRFELHFFAREVDVPVRLFEWRRYTLKGFGPIRKQLFYAVGVQPAED